jgi:Na+/proline symporter
MNFSIIDWIIVIAYLLLMLLIGYLSSRNNKTAEDYILGGKTMNPFMIGISLFATLFSTLSYLSYPGEMIKYGPVFLAGILALPLANWIVGKFLIPKFMQMNVKSAYETSMLRI